MEGISRIQSGDQASHGMFRLRSLHAALVLVWASVAIMACGAYLRQQSPRFDRWQQNALQEIARKTDGPMIAAAFGSHWHFGLLFDMVAATVFTVGLLAAHALIRRTTILPRDLAAGSALACLLGAIPGLSSGLDALRWGFVVLVLGYGLLTVGLAFGATSLWLARPR